MNATSAFSFPTFSSFPSHLPDLASSWLDSSSQCIDSIFLNADASINPSSTPGNTLSSESLFTPPPSPTDSSFFGFVPLNNSTNNSISLQPLPSHGASDLQSPTDVEQNARENMPPFQSATIASGSKRKADRDETISGPSLKKSRTLPIGQEPSQKPEEPRAGQPLEITNINVELTGLCSFPVDSSVELPSCGHLLTIREDVSRAEDQFYPYLWFPDRPPYKLQAEDYGNIFPRSHIDAMQKTLRTLGVVCGTLALTASKQVVLFFEPGEREVVQDAMKKRMGPSFNHTRWQGAAEITGQNHAVSFIGHHGQPQSGGSDAPQSNTGHQIERLPQNGLSLHCSPNNLTTHQVQANAISSQPQSTASYNGPSVDSRRVGPSSNSVVAEPSAPSQKRRATHRPERFVFVSAEMAKRRRNGHTPGIPMPVLDTPPSLYPSNTVFAETHTKESFPHPQNTNAVAVPKRKNRRRAPAKSGGKGNSATATATATQRSHVEHEEVTKKPRAQRGKRRSKKAQDPEPSQDQAGPSGSTAPEPEAPVYSISHQVSNNIFPQENVQAPGSYNQYQIGYAGNIQESAPFNSVLTSQTPASLPTDQFGLGVAAEGYIDDMALASQASAFGCANTLGGGYYTSLDFGGHYQLNASQPSFPSAWDQAGFATHDETAVSHNQLQPSHVGFDANGSCNLFNHQELTTPFTQNLMQDNFQQPLYLQPPGFVSRNSAGGFPGDGPQAWNFDGVY